MLNKRTIVIILAVSLFTVSTGFSQTLEQNWENFLHFTRVGNLELAKGFAQVILDGDTNPAELFVISKQNAQAMTELEKAKNASDAELAELATRLLAVIEQGSFAYRSDQTVIITEIRRLNSTERGWLTATQRLKNAGEYAIPLMIDALSDPSRQDEAVNIARALPLVGRDAIRPLAVALQSNNTVVKSQIVEALAQIGYSQVLPYLKYIAEQDGSAELRSLANRLITQVDPASDEISAAQLFYNLAENYYYHAQSLAPIENGNFANIWFWSTETRQLEREEVPTDYFYELMAMRCCEWALKADSNLGSAISLWIASYFKAESAGTWEMPEYFGLDHPDASMYAVTAGVEYLHEALARAIKDNDAYIALGLIEALATTAGEQSLFYRIGQEQPLVQALSFNDRMVRYSAAIAIASACPQESFAGVNMVVANLAEALSLDMQAQTENGLWNADIAASYLRRSAEAMLELASTHNTVIDLSPALETLVNVTDSGNPEIQILAGRILSHLSSSQAQQAIARVAVDPNKAMEVRLAAFNSLAESAKLNANKLTEPQVQAIYNLINDSDDNAVLRDAAAAAYGALNLPSRQVKNLIIDQAKS